MFMEKVWQKQAIHLPVVLVKKSCVQENVKITKEGKVYMKSDDKNESFNVEFI